MKPVTLFAFLALLLAAPTARAAEANTGTAGSVCRAVTSESAVPPRPFVALDTASLGPAAPAAYEIQRPVASADQAPVMILLHGGGWYTVGERAMQSLRTFAGIWRRAGWQTVSTSYAACGRSLASVLQTYDLVRQQVGPDRPICLFGQSSGGHLALYVAARRKDVACVIAEGAPTNLPALARQGAAETRSSSRSAPKLRAYSRGGEYLAKAAFGSRLKQASPIEYASRTRARIALGVSEDDPFIPTEQSRGYVRALKDARPSAFARSARLESGDVTLFTHAGVSPAALQSWVATISKTVSPFGNGPVPG